jgi:hypothetical protein
MSSYVKEFANLLTGHKASFVIHVPPFTKQGNKVKASQVKYKKSNGLFVPLSVDDYERHLKGEIGLAVSPLTGNTDGIRDSCFFAVIDIDVYDSAFTVDQIKDLVSEYPCYVTKSKSGGFHIFFFFKELQNAHQVRETLKFISYITGIKYLFGDKVEIFPEYDYATDKQAHCIFLPFFGAKEIEVVKFIREADKKLTTVETLERINTVTEFNFLPVCIEAKLKASKYYPLTHRNNFLFSVATFLLNTSPDDADFLFKEISKKFIAEDFPEEEVNLIFKSAKSKRYSFFGRCKSPELSEICNKKICERRKFDGVGLFENNPKGRVVTNVDFGQLYKYNALKPFYIWEIRKSGTNEDYRKVRFDNLSQLLNQKIAQAIIGEAVDTIFLTLKNDIWEKHVELALKEMIVIDVHLFADSSDLALAVRAVYQFLIEQLYPYEEPYCMFQGRVYKKDDCYYFLVEAVISYLQAKGLNKKVNIYAALSNMNATTEVFEGVEVWCFRENKTFKDLLTFREKVREIERKTLEKEIETRFLDKNLLA